LGRMEKSVEIRARPEKVWEMLALDRFQEWMVGLASRVLDLRNVEFTSDVHNPEDKYRVGASALAPAEKETLKVTESLKNEKITYLLEEESGKNAGAITLILEPIEEGTKLTYAVEYEMPWGVFGKFIEKLFSKRMGERDIEKSLEKLKSILEK